MTSLLSDLGWRTVAAVGLSLPVGVVATEVTANASVLPQSTGKLITSTRSGRDELTLTGEDNVIATLEADHAESSEDASLNATVSALISGGASPLDTPFVSAQAAGNASGPITRSAQLASAQIWYSAGLIQEAEPPRDDPIPIKILFKGSVSQSGGGSAWAEAHIGLRFPNTSSVFPTQVFNIRRSAGDPAEPFEIEDSVTRWLRLGSTFDFYLEAGAAVAMSGEGPFPSTSSAQAVADPILRFDQEAFDQLNLDNGRPTFNLAHYYSFELSEGVNGNGIPEPTTAVLLLLGIAAGAVRRPSKSDG